LWRWRRGLVSCTCLSVPSWSQQAGHEHRAQRIAEKSNRVLGTHQRWRGGADCPTSWWVAEWNPSAACFRFCTWGPQCCVRRVVSPLTRSTSTPLTHDSTLSTPPHQSPRQPTYLVLLCFFFFPCVRVHVVLLSSSRVSPLFCRAVAHRVLKPPRWKSIKFIKTCNAE
jgi:hypothetical protein